MSEFLSFLVVGEPAPKGSWKVVQRGKFARLINDSRKTAPWCEAVADAAHVACGKIGASVPMFVRTALLVDVTFMFKRPQGHWTKGGRLKASAPLQPMVKPDLDKLVRSTLDALTGIVFDDDARVVACQSRKGYGETAGAVVRVSLG